MENTRNQAAGEFALALFLERGRNDEQGKLTWLQRLERLIEEFPQQEESPDEKVNT